MRRTIMLLLATSLLLASNLPTSPIDAARVDPSKPTLFLPMIRR